MRWLFCMLFSGLACAQEGPPQGTGPWEFEEIIIGVVELEKGSRIVVINNGEPKIVTRTFGTFEACNKAREALPATGVSVPLGTGGGALADLGRVVSPCYSRN